MLYLKAFHDMVLQIYKSIFQKKPSCPRNTCTDHWRKQPIFTAFLEIFLYLTLREKCPYSELFWSGFCRICIEYKEMRSIPPNSVQMQENAYQDNSESGHFFHIAKINGSVEHV